MFKKYIDLLDSVQAAQNLALAVFVNAGEDSKKKEIADRYLDDVMKEIWRTRVALSEVLKLQQNEIHDNYRYPRVSADLPKQ